MYTNDIVTLKPSRESVVVDAVYTECIIFLSVFDWSGAGMSVTASSLCDMLHVFFLWLFCFHIFLTIDSA